MDITGKMWKKHQVGDLNFVAISRLADNSFIKYKRQKTNKAWAMAVRSYTDEQILKLFEARHEDAKRYSTQAENRARLLLDSARQTIARIRSAYDTQSTDGTRIGDNKKLETKQ